MVVVTCIENFSPPPPPLTISSIKLMMKKGN